MDAFHKRLWGMLAFMVLVLALNAGILVSGYDGPAFIIRFDECPPEARAKSWERAGVAPFIAHNGR